MKVLNSFSLFLLGLCISVAVPAKEFVHPGGLHTLSDLDRMKEKVQARETPWIQSWNLLTQNWKAQSTYNAGPSSNIGGGGNRQRASQDANAAYLNTLRWYISGDTQYADCAVRILNSWAKTVTEASGELFQLPIKNMMYVAEILRAYPGWKEADQEKFKEVSLNVFYPACKDFLGTCWRPASWDSPAVASVLAIGIFCDREDIYNEAIEYYKNGVGNGSLLNSIWKETGQIAEMGRDQPHATIGPACLAEMAQMAFNQGDNSLYEYSNNRLLAGFEYYCKYNLNHKDVPFTKWYSCISENLSYMSPSGANRIRQSPVYEMLYNHYALKMELETPYTKAMAELARPEAYDDADFFGGGTLAYTLDPSKSPYPPLAVPAAPVELTTTVSDSYVILNWKAPAEHTAQGYTVYRSTQENGSYTQIASWNSNTSTEYTDRSAVNGQTYYYTVSASNQSGMGPRSEAAEATPAAATGNFPAGWFTRDIGTAQKGNSGSYFNGSFFLSSNQGDWTADNKQRMILAAVKGDAVFTARLFILENDQEWERGIMIRETLNPKSRMIAIATGWPLARYSKAHYRNSTGGDKIDVGAHQFLSVPCWFRIERKGNKFTVYESGEGIYWTEVTTQTISMSETYYVALFNTSGHSVYDHVTVECNEELSPTAPTDFQAEALDYKTINLSWKKTGTGSCYVLERSKGSEDHYETIVTSLYGTSYQDTDLETGTEYFYRIRAANLNGTSEPLTTRAKPELGLPRAPAILTVENGNSSVTLNWSNTGDRYRVLRSEIQGGPYEPITTVDALSYTDSPLENDKSYYYVVAALNEAGESENSAESVGKPKIGKFLYFPFNETSGTTATDIWAKRKGTLQPDAAWATGKYDNGLALNGTTNSYLTLPNGIMNSLTSFTLSAWVYPNEIRDWARLLDFGTGESYNMFLTLRGGDGKTRFAIKNGGEEQIIESNSTVAARQWHHIVVTFHWENGKGRGTLYVNGVAKGSNTNMTISPSMLPLTTQNYLGKSQYSSDPNLNGIIDEFQIYSSALTAKQVSDLYNNTTSIHTVLSEELFTVYPNPVTDKLTISSPGDANSKTLFSLYTMEGVLIKSLMCSPGENVMDLSDVGRGVYLGILQSAGKKQAVKIMKN